MIKKLASLSHKTLLILLIVLVAVGAMIYFRSNDNKADKAEYPKYLNFGGDYVFDVPKDYSVDEQSVPGAQLVYTGSITAKTVEDVYNADGIAVQVISGLTDHSGKAFKDYVNKTFIEDLKKNISPDDVKVKFGKANGADNARVTATKDGKTFRFIYLKGGQHPAQVISKTETSSVKKIAETIVDVESSKLKDETGPLKKAIQDTAQFVKGKKTAELYASAAPDLRSSSSQEDLDKALKAAAKYSEGNITISGGSYNPNEFASAIRFTEANKENPQPAFGSMIFKKIGGQWKLEALSLPTPKQ